MEPEAVGRYKFESVIAIGGMAIIRKGYDPMFNRPVAIKTIKTELQDDPEYQERFRVEAEILGRLSHPNIVDVYEKIEQDGKIYLIMKYLGTESLEGCIKEGSLPRFDKRLEIVQQLASCLSYMHEAGVIHRDLSPKNIMLVDGIPVIIDFGIAKLAGVDLELTQPGHFIGNPRFASPEQITKDRDMTPQSDIFCLGILAMLILQGTHPFERPNTAVSDQLDIQAWLRAIAEEPPELKIPIGVDGDRWHSVFLKVFQKDPWLRYVSAKEFFEALSPCYNAHIGTIAMVRPGSCPTPRQGRKPDRVIKVLSGPREGHVYDLSRIRFSNMGSGMAAFQVDYDRYVSDTHALVSNLNGQVAIKDLHSQYGTYAGGRRLACGNWVSINQLFVLGTTLFQVCDKELVPLDSEPLYIDNLNLMGTAFENLGKCDFFGTKVVDTLSLFLYSLEHGDLIPSLEEIGHNVIELEEKVHSGTIFSGSQSWLNEFIRKNRRAFEARRILITPMAANLVQNSLRGNMLEAWLNSGFNLVHPLLGFPELAQG